MKPYQRVLGCVFGLFVFCASIGVFWLMSESPAVTSRRDGISLLGLACFIGCGSGVGIIGTAAFGERGDGDAAE